MLKSDRLAIKLNSARTSLESFKIDGRELLASAQPLLFLLRARDKKGGEKLFSPDKAEIISFGSETRYCFESLTVCLKIKVDGQITWSFAVENRSDLAIEFLDLPNVCFAGKLRENGGECAVISSYNEGLLVEDYRLKTGMVDPEYPSHGGYMMYPYMLSSPLQMWLYGGEGISMYVRDPENSPKGLDFACSEESTQFRTRIFLGGEYGESIARPIETVWEHFVGDWQDGAEIYRRQVYEKLSACRVIDLDLPKWYTEDMPLVITYPVRGIHDCDEMKPNKLFPYPNVLPLVDEFSARTGAKIMVLLMHWEGTAPWAPPYVYPPYGGEGSFKELMNRLHAEGNLLGVYCSGLSFTEKSNLVADYDCSELIRSQGLEGGFCKAPDQAIVKSRICPAQRSGYDICAASRVGRDVLNEALAPLLASGVDYVQALDQNHGGGMYFCYANDHGHPPVPGGWMTKASAQLLRGWKEAAPNTLLGCESAAAEPYINDLRLSDNRYELCYRLGKPIPLYAYLYHRYLHNFMGNQVDCQVEYSTEGLCARIAYSFAAGDMITLVLNDDGEIMFHWGMRDFSRVPDRDRIIGFCRELHSWHDKYPRLFCDGEMVKPLRYICETVELSLRCGGSRTEPAVYSTAWRTEGRNIQLFVNHSGGPVEVTLEKAAVWLDSNGAQTVSDRFTVAPLSAAAVEY